MVYSLVKLLGKKQVLKVERKRSREKRRGIKGDYLNLSGSDEAITLRVSAIMALREASSVGAGRGL